MTHSLKDSHDFRFSPISVRVALWHSKVSVWEVLCVVVVVVVIKVKSTRADTNS